MNDRVGQQLGNYRLVRLLGQGGFADVYLGEHIYLKTPAAIKVLQTRLVQDDLQVFLKEARAIANLVHPHIVRVLEFGVQGDVPFLVMDNAPNGTLRQRHPKGTQVPPPVISAYIKQVASALQYAHDQRLVHRDIKPENMLLGRNNEVLLSDFGIAIVAQSSRYQQSGQDVGGTIAYMAPEQLQGHAVPASDQYALGIVVYEWVCGERPFKGSFPEIASQHMLAAPVPLRSRVPGLPPAIDEVVQRALAKTPQQRFANVQAFAQALEQASQSGQLSQSGANYSSQSSTFVPPPPSPMNNQSSMGLSSTFSPGQTPPFPPVQQGTPSGISGSMGANPSGQSFVNRNMPQSATPPDTFGTVPMAPGQAPPNFGGFQPQPGTPSGIYGAGGTVPPGQSSPNPSIVQQGMPSGNYGAVPSGQMTPNFAAMQQSQQGQPGIPSGNYTNFPPGQSAQPAQPGQPIPNSGMLPGQFVPPPAPGGNQPKKGIPRRALLIGAATLVVVIGGGSFYVLSQKSNNGSTGSTGGATTTPANNTAPTTAPTSAATPTDTPTDTPTTDPNATPTPTTVPTVQTTPGAILYTADWSSGMNGWAGSADWKVLNGALLNDGTSSNSNNGPTVVPPFQLEGINDYAIETKIQVVSYKNGYSPQFGLALRGSTVNGNWAGYEVSIGNLDSANYGSNCNANIDASSSNSALTSAPYDPAKGAHTYRFEAKGNTLRFFIDGGSVLQTTDNQFLSGAQVGLWSNNAQLSVTSFKIIAL